MMIYLLLHFSGISNVRVGSLSTTHSMNTILTYPENYNCLERLFLMSLFYYTSLVRAK
ncbi:hypothetical protein MOSE0_M09142 [Monosporozyma servazzii]